MNSDATSSAWYSDPDVLLATLRKAEQSTPSAPAPEIGGYRDLFEIARGGQGVVYSGIQSSTSRRVAIKLLTPRSEHDERARRRFTREVSLAARLRHPNIVRIYDSGSTDDGRLYCVMDYIEGESLRDRLRSLGERNRPGSGEFAEVLSLFRTITLALSAAHQKGVIHRDLKPSNIRVDASGEPHLLDFGLAKAIEGGDELSGSTPTITEQTGHFAGSLPWASPEQASGETSEIDVRTDIYSVGVMLHHALTGEFPYDVSGPIRQTLNTIAEAPPVAARTLNPRIPRDLERVILTCLAKDKTRRYQSAAALAEDIRRVMEGEPILAQADSAWRSMNRSLQRYRAVVTVVVALGITLGAFGVAMSLLYSRAVHAESIARQESSHASAVNAFLEQMLASSSPGSLGRDVLVRDMLDRAAPQLIADSGIDPDARAALHGVIASTYSAIGEFEPALRHAREASILGASVHGPNHERTLEYRNLVGGQLYALSRFDEAEAEINEALRIAGDSLAPDHATLLSLRSSRALLLAERGAYDEAIEIHRAVYEARSQMSGGSKLDAITSLHHLAIEESAAGRYDDSLSHYQRASELAHDELGPDHPRTLTIRSGLAVAAEQRGDTQRSAEILREIIPIAERVWGADHRDTNIMKTNLAYALNVLGDYETALPLTREIYESSLRSLGPTHTDTVNARNGLASAMYQQGDYHGATVLLEESRGSSIEAFGRLHVRSLDSGANLAQVLRRAGDLDRAGRVAEEVLVDAREYYGTDNPELAWFIKVAGDIRLERGNPLGAVALLEDARRLAAMQNDSGFRRSVLKSLIRALVDSGDAARARETVDDCVDLMRRNGESEEEIEAVRSLVLNP